MKTSGNQRPEQNRILACLPARERKILQEDLELVSLRSREELNELDSPIRYLYFPLDCAISLMDFKPAGGVVEVAVVGKEGCIGFTVVQGYKNAVCRVLVQVGGSAFRVSAASVTRSLHRVPFLRYALARFSSTILREAVISVGCSQFHSVEQRLGRWLLANQDRTGRSVFAFTHDFLAEQLGVQRATVSEALASLHDEKIIRNGYREVELTNVRDLEKVSCECFPSVKDTIDEFLRDLRSQSSTKGELQE
jgi:CRP-like cAMP-binding protein